MGLAVGFARVLRSAGLEVAAGASIEYARALAAVGLERPEAVYWAGRATLCHRPDDFGLYDAAFAAYWHGGAGPLPRAPEGTLVDLATDGGVERGGSPEDDPSAGSTGRRPTAALRYSRLEVLRHRDFAACTPSELEEAQRLMATIRLGGALRRSHRRRPARRGDRPDLRETLRRSLRTGGEPVPPRWRGPVTRPRTVVVLCDVSGSMAPYARALLRFCHGSVAGRSRVEAFAMGTRLTRLTRELTSRDPDTALERAGQAVPDWSGGTRLGEALRAFNDRWGTKGTARGAVVVVCSDGWDRGDPALLAQEMARLARVAHRVVWANPLKAAPGFEPLARGMAAALPHVDHFVEGHSLASLEDLARLVRQVRQPGWARSRRGPASRRAVGAGWSAPGRRPTAR